MDKMPTIDEALEGNIAEGVQFSQASQESLPDPLTPSEIPASMSLYPPEWTDEKEEGFQNWYKGWADQTGINPDPDDPRHLYNYRSAYEGGAFPEPDGKGEFHWPSEYKMPNHPNRFVNGVDTITGQPMTIDQSLEVMQRKHSVPDSQMAWWEKISKSFLSGGVSTADTYARAGRTLGLETSEIIETIGKAKEKVSVDDAKGFAGYVAKAIDSTINSIGAGIPGMALGAVTRRPFIGFAIGAGTLFSLAEYDRFMEEAEALGLKREDVKTEAVISAIAEGGVEALQDLILGHIYGLTGKGAKEALKAPVKEALGKLVAKFIARTSVAAPIEALGEVGTGIIQTEARQAAGFDMPNMSIDEALETTIVTGLQTVMMGGLATGVTRRQETKEYKRYQENKLKWWAERLKRAGVDIAPAVKEAVPEEMGALPAAAEEEAAPTPPPTEAGELEARVPTFPTIKAAQQAGIDATEEEVDQFKVARQDLLDEAEFYKKSGNPEQAMQILKEVKKYTEALEAYEHPDRYRAEPTPAQAIAQDVQERRAPDAEFDFNDQKDRAWLKSLGYSEAQIDQASKIPPGRLRTRRLEEPSELPGTISPEELKRRIPAVARTYQEAAATARPEQNIISRPATKTGRVLLAQIAPQATSTTAEPGVADAYFDKLYTAREGYTRTDDFWEVPMWIPTAAASITDSDMMAIRDPELAAAQIQEAGYEAVMFSALDVNKHVIKALAEQLGPGVRVIVGGYVNKSYFKDTPNVEFFDNMQEAAKALGVEPKEGTDTKHFKKTPTVPRLCMSEGCLHKCAFCTIPKDVKARSDESIDQQLEDMKNLSFKLVYLDDKTFGQAKNYNKLSEIFAKIKAFNKDFQGFIIQTTAPQFLKLDDAFIQESGIRFVELGVESYNDDILAKIHKPHRTKIIDQAVEKIRRNGIAFIPNILVGLTGKGWSETAQSYKNTLNFLYANDDIISHANIYNLALYEGTELANQIEEREDIDLDENAVARSYHKDPALHEKFYRAVVKFATEQLDKSPFPTVTVDAGMRKKAVIPEEKAQISLFKEKKKKERTIDKWVNATGEEVVDEETGEKVKTTKITAEAAAALEKAGVQLGPGRFKPVSNFLVSLTDNAGLIFGLARKGDKKVVRQKDTLTGVITIEEYFRKIGGVEFKVLNTPIMPKGRKEKAKLIDNLVEQYKEFLGWYQDWNDYMQRFKIGKFTEQDITNFIKIQGLLSAGASPAVAQTSFGKIQVQLEEHPDFVVGGEGKGFTANMAKKINTILKGEDVEIQTLEQYQKAYGPKIGAFIYAGIHPGILEGAVVVDRHIARLWGYNAMWGGSFRVTKNAQQEITEDIVEAAQRHNVPVPALQATLWYAAGAGHWGSATRFEEAIRISPKQALGPVLTTLITEEPQAIISFRKNLHFALHGPRAPQALTSKERARLVQLRDTSKSFMLFGGLTEAEHAELLELQSKKEGDKPNSWSRSDVQKRMDASTKDNRYVPLTCWYGPGVRRETFFWGAIPHLTRIYEGEIYDATTDTLGYVPLAMERANNDSEVKAGRRSVNDVFMNALAGLIKRTGDFKGFSSLQNGQAWFYTFDETPVEEFETEVQVSVSDVIQGVMNLPQDLQGLADVSGELVRSFNNHIVAVLKDYPITVVQADPTIAMFDDATSGELEYGMSLTLRGPITAVRAAVSLVSRQKQQQLSLVFHKQGATNGTLISFRLRPEDLSRVQTELRQHGISNFNIRRSGEGWLFEAFVYAGDETMTESIKNLYTNQGVPDTIEHVEVRSEQLTMEPIEGERVDYKHHILNYFGKKKGEEVYGRAEQDGAKWQADASNLFSTSAAITGVQGDEAGRQRSISKDFRKPEDPQTVSKEVTDGTVDALLGGVNSIALTPKAKGILGRALAMTKEGVDKTRIWKETGWIQGADSLWRFEVDDNKAKIAVPDKWPENPKLKDVLKHPDLYGHYPQLQEIPILTIQGQKGGSYLPLPFGIITVGSEQLLDLSELTETIFHETQHAIQDVEGFAMGTSAKAEMARLEWTNMPLEEKKSLAEAMYWMTAGEIEAQDTTFRLILDSSQKKKIAPYTSPAAEILPMDKWVIRMPGKLSFGFDPQRAEANQIMQGKRGFIPPTEVQLRNLQKIPPFAESIRKAIELSGLSKYKSVMDRTTLLLKPYVDLPTDATTEKTKQEWARRFDIEVAELERQLSTGETNIYGLTSVYGPVKALIELSTTMHTNWTSLERGTFHEIWHLFERWVVSPDLMKDLEKLIPSSEDRADAFRDYVVNMEAAKEKRTLPEWVYDIWDKILDFLWRVRHAAMTEEITSANQVFELLQRGRVEPHFGERRVDNRRGFTGDAGLIQDLDDMESGEATTFVSQMDRSSDFKFDSEEVARKRIKENVVESWMSLDEDAWIPEPTQAMREPDHDTPAAFDMAIITKIYEELTGGKLPTVRKLLFKDAAIRGVFLPGHGHVKLKAEIFRNPMLACRVLAHEIGHLVDWLPDRLIKGTILGKISGIKDFVGKVLPFEPGAPGELDAADLARLRQEAIDLLGVKKIERKKWIEDVIEKQLGITAEDVLAIWNSVENAKLLTPELHNYVAGLSSEAKKLIVKAALKGQLADTLKNFVRVERTVTGRRQEVVTEEIPPTQEEIKQKLAALVNEEIKKRKLWVEEEVRDELKTLSVRWRPFDPAQATMQYLHYRWSSAELYADAISALFVDPAFLRAQAPRFYQAFFNWLDNKPEVRRVYDEIQLEIRAGSMDKTLTKDLYEMFDKGNDAYALLYEDLRAPLKDSMKRDFLDAFHFILKDVRKIEGQVPTEDNPRYALEKMVYTASEIEAFMTDLYANVIKPLEKANLKWDREFGLVTFLRRIVKGRDKIANPRGWGAERAFNKLYALKHHELTSDQWEAMRVAVKNFRELHEKYFIDKAEAAEIFDAAMIKLFRDNDTYATFDNAYYLKQRYGRSVATRVYQQVGQLQEITNPATATVMKDVAMIRAVNRNHSIRTIVKFYLDYAQNLGVEIRPADKKWNGRFMAIKEPDDKKLGLLTYLHKGKAYGYYLPRHIADAVNENHVGYTSTARAFRWFAAPMRKIFTEINYGFWIFNAFFRDAGRFFMAIPGKRIDQFAKYWLSGLKPAFRSVFAIPDTVIQEMQRENMLISVADYRGLTTEDQQVERLLRMYNMKGPKEYNSKIMQPFGHMFNWVTNKARMAEYYFSATGKALERTTKVGAYIFLRDKFPDMPLDVVGHIVRVRGGSPDFLRAGREHALYNNILLFSNAMKEGYRGDWEAYKENPGDFLLKKLVLVAAPKLLMWAGLLGLLGEAIKKIFEGVSEYDNTNYLIIPLGVTRSGKSIYWRIPTDETSRFLGGILWKILRTPQIGPTEQAGALFDYMAGQAPTITPALGAVMDTIDYASGKNPYDRFYGRHAIGEVEFAAHDRRAHLQFLQYLAGKMGASIVYKFKHDKIEKVAEELESIIGFPVKSQIADFTLKLPDQPVVSNVLGRFLKVSDYGVREDILRSKAVVKRDNARSILDAREAAWAIVDGRTPSNEQLMALAQKPDVVNRQIMLGLARKYGMVYFEEWLSSGTSAEKFAVLSKMLEKNALAGQDIMRMLPTEPWKGSPTPPKGTAGSSEYPSLDIKNILEQGE